MNTTVPYDAADPAERQRQEIIERFLAELEQASDRGAVRDEYCEQHAELAPQLNELFGLYGELDEAAACHQSSLPQRLGDFEIVRRIDSGGQAIILEALQRRLNRRVVIKIPRDAGIDPQAQSRFMREQLTLARLHQTNIVPIYHAAVAEHQGRPLPYYVMPYIDGVALSDVVRAARAFEPSRSGEKIPSLASLAVRTDDQAKAGTASEGGSAPVAAGNRDASETGAQAADDRAPDAASVRQVSEAGDRKRSRLLSADYLDSVAACLADVARAIEHAHRARIIHRDLSPRNIMINRAGQCWVIDFGLASHLQSQLADSRVADSKLADSLGELHSDARSEPTTSPRARTSPPANSVPDAAGIRNALMPPAGPRSKPERTADSRSVAHTTGAGTPHYMAPEQFADGVALDRRTDIWSLGAILYELITLRQPFDDWNGENIWTGRGAHISDLVRPRKHVPTLPRDLESICLKCLSIDPEGRYQTAADLAADLDRYVRREPVLARPLSRARRAWRWCQRNKALAGFWSAVVVLLLTFAIGGPVVAWHQSELRSSEQTQRERAEELLESIGDLHYHDGILFAQQAWKNGNLARARSLIKMQVPANPGEKDRRGWEWHFLNRATTGGHPILKGHDGPVLSVACHPNARLAVTGGEDGTARLWNIETGRPLRILRGHTGPINAVAFSPDGTLIATAGDDTTAIIWETATGRFRHRLDRHILPINDLEITPDGEQLVTGSDDATVKVWDVRSGKEIRTISDYGLRVSALAVTPDGRSIAAASGQTLQFHQLDVGELKRTLKFDKTIQHLALSADGDQLLLALGQRTTVRELLVADVSTGATLKPFKFKQRIWHIGFAPVGRGFAVALDNNTVRLWKGLLDKEPVELRGHTGPVRAAAFALDGRRIVTGADDALALVWQTDGDPGITRLDGHELAVYSLAFNDDGSRLASVGMDISARLWDTATGLEIARLGRGTVVHKFDENGLPQRQIIEMRRGDTAHTNFVMDVAFSPDGTYIATAGFDKLAKIWDAGSGALLHDLPHAWQVSVVAFSSNGRSLATAGWGDVIRIWDVESGKQLRELWGHGHHIEDLAYSPDGKLIASASWDGTVRLWDTDSGKATRVLKAHHGGVYCVAFDPNGQWLASAGKDSLFRIWNAATGETVATLEGHDGMVRQLAVSPDGRRLASAGWDEKVVRLWDTSNWRQTMALEDQLRVAFSRDGLKLATASGTSIRIWDGTPLKQQLPRDDAQVPAAPESQAPAADDPGGIKALGYGVFDALPGRRLDGTPEILQDKDKKEKFLVIALSMPHRMLMPSPMEFAEIQRLSREDGEVPPDQRHRNRYMPYTQRNFSVVLPNGRSATGLRITKWPPISSRPTFDFFAGSITHFSSQSLDPDSRAAFAVAWRIDPAVHEGPYRVRFKDHAPVKVPEVQLNPDRLRDLRRIWHEGPVEAPRPPATVRGEAK